MVSQVCPVVLPATNKVSAAILATMDHASVSRWFLGLVAPVVSLGSKRAGGTSARHDPMVYYNQTFYFLSSWVKFVSNIESPKH